MNDPIDEVAVGSASADAGAGMVLSYPNDCITPGDRREYIDYLKEKLRLIQNGFVRWRTIGLTLNQYEKFPTIVKNKYAYVSRLSNDLYQQFFIKDFEPRQRKLMRAARTQRGLAKQSTRWPNKGIGDI